MNTKVNGLHHITAISSDVTRNMQFYTRVLGLRFVKKSVNQDEPGRYHRYYGADAGSPGTILTFFPWAGLRRGRRGSGKAYARGFSVPAGTLPYWQKRFNEFKVETAAIEKRFDDEVLPFFDTDGLRLELVATSETDIRVPDDATQNAARAQLLESGLHVSPVIDRAYFKSIYYREPGGVLFEIATDQPGFAIDEPVETLGSRLTLPPHLEPDRAEIEAAPPRRD